VDITLSDNRGNSSYKMELKIEHLRQTFKLSKSKFQISTSDVNQIIYFNFLYLSKTEEKSEKKCLFFIILEILFF